MFNTKTRKQIEAKTSKASSENDTRLLSGINTEKWFFSLYGGRRRHEICSPQKMPQACLLKSVQILLAQMLFRIITSPKYFSEVREK